MCGEVVDSVEQALGQVYRLGLARGPPRSVRMDLVADAAALEVLDEVDWVSCPRRVAFVVPGAPLDGGDRSRGRFDQRVAGDPLVRVPVSACSTKTGSALSLVANLRRRSAIPRSVDEVRGVTTAVGAVWVESTGRRSWPFPDMPGKHMGWSQYQGIRFGRARYVPAWPRE